ncbi:MAG: hypothetical protein U5K29_08925 [Acidimicrobiales bacterium]|nr:hypothetical protein [Acidimicrobiales bacterium]
MSNTPRHRWFIAVLAALMMLLAACGNDDDPAAVGAGDDGTSEADTDDAPDTDDDEDTDDTTTTTAEPTTTTTEPEVASGAECVIGTWVSDNDAFAETMESMAEGQMTVESVTGPVTIELRADGSVTTTYDQWTINAVMTNPSGEATIVRDGVDHGTYTAGDDGSFSMTEVESNSTVEATATVGGQTMTMPPVEGMQTDLMGGAGTFECEGDRMSIQVEGGTAWMDRVG